MPQGSPSSKYLSVSHSYNLYLFPGTTSPQTGSASSPSFVLTTFIYHTMLLDNRRAAIGPVCLALSLPFSQQIHFHCPFSAPYSTPQGQQFLFLGTLLVYLTLPQNFQLTKSAVAYPMLQCRFSFIIETVLVAQTCQSVPSAYTHRAFVPKFYLACGYLSEMIHPFKK